MTDDYYDEVDLDELIYDEKLSTFTYPCPCGDIFRLSQAEMDAGEDIARCPSCSLLLKVLF